jgi:hypothetical protein
MEEQAYAVETRISSWNGDIGCYVDGRGCVETSAGVPSS